MFTTTLFIVGMLNGAPFVGSAEFNTEESCIHAAQQVDHVFNTQWPLYQDGYTDSKEELVLNCAENNLPVNQSEQAVSISIQVMNGIPIIHTNSYGSMVACISQQDYATHQFNHVWGQNVMNPLDSRMYVCTDK